MAQNIANGSIISRTVEGEEEEDFGPILIKKLEVRLQWIAAKIHLCRKIRK